MYFCYLDESGTPEFAGTSHFVLVGFAIPCNDWKHLESRIDGLKRGFSLGDAEVHTAWMARRYVDQEAIPGFERLSHADRRRACQQRRDQHLLRIAATGSKKQLNSAKLNYRKTNEYIHLTQAERMELIRQLADCIGSLSEARLFAQAVDKQHLQSLTAQALPPYEYSFTELIQRFEYFLVNRGRSLNQDLRGLIVQDYNETVARKITEIMLGFHRKGTRWTSITQIVETPFFVDSRLTSMVQMADLCGYAIRRYFENGESDLLDRIFSRFDRTPQGVVGIHHFTSANCQCKVCSK